MHSARKVLWAFLLVTPLFLGTVVFGNDVDDEIPGVTARVARISFIRGDVQIRRAGAPDWERAVLNLPLVEGDEITTDERSRFEIQFNSYTHLRVAENSYLNVISLKDEGIALSLPNGTLSLRVTDFAKDETFLEIDAPKTTVSIQKAGMYRVDAGKEGEGQVRVSVTDNGEALVYSENSGFTLKNGRTAKINIEGNYSGEWETADAARFADEFDTWSLERDATIAKRLKDAHYDQYYDRDIYGAEDLGEYGEWVHTRKYGYVWKPFRNSVSQYADWSPYRYGHWRWVGPYGWTWVNDEPWGWATYHHGRWVYDNSNWYWTPYGQYRNRRSWWSPALVGLTIINNNICWYPLTYNQTYYNYNYYYGNHGGNHGPGRGNPTPTPIGPVQPVSAIDAIRAQRRLRMLTPPLLRVPLNGVVSVPLSEFGRDKAGVKAVPPDVAKAVLSKVPEQTESIRMLLTVKELNGKVSSSIRPEKQRIPISNVSAQTGAAKRISDGPIGEALRKLRIFGDRQPLPLSSSDVKAGMSGDTGPRKTGAVTRPILIRQADQPVKQAPADTPPTKYRDEPVRPEPTYTPETKRRRETQNEPIKPERYDPPQKHREEPQNEPVKQPRNDSPKRSEPPPKSDPVKVDKQTG